MACNPNRPFGKLLCKWGDFERAKTNFKMLLASWFLVCSLKRVRSLNAENLGSVDKRASKLLTIKVGGLKKKSAFQPRPPSNRSARVHDHQGSNHSPSLMAGKFAALWPTDPKFSAFKDLNLFKKHTKNQEASCILRVFFALSKWPHLYREFSGSAVSSDFNCKCAF